MMDQETIRAQLMKHLRELHLPTIREIFEETAREAQQESLGYEAYLLEVVTREIEERRRKRIERYLKESSLPLEKELETFDLKRLPMKVINQVNLLKEGFFLDKKENVLAFGLPGTGKTHLLCGLSQALVRRGRRILCTRCSLFVQQLLVAKKELKLRQVLKKLQKFEAVLIDDIGYVQQNREEMEVLFTFLAERYEQGSVMITSNLPFSKWERIFKDPMTTAAAIDRVVHHSIIIELNLPSYRMEAAQKKAKQPSE